MADHRVTSARLREVARQRYPDDGMTAEAAARALFDAEEAASYAADLDTRAEEQGIVDTARAAKRLRGELREELRAKGSSAGGTEEEYVHLDNDDLDADNLVYLELPTDEAARRLMAAERRAVAHQSARQSAYLRNLAAADEVRAVAAGWRPREDRARVVAERRLQYERARAAELARVREHQYPLPSYYTDARIAEDA
jgi:hypothetical protein